MRKKELLQIPPMEAPEGLWVNVVARCQVVKEILNIDLFYMGELKVRYFADRKAETHIVYAGGAWSRCGIENAERLCRGEKEARGGWIYGANEIAWAEKQEKRLAYDYLETTVSSWEYRCGRGKKEKANERKEERIRRAMDLVPCVTEEMEQWVRDEVFPGHYLFYRNGSTRTDYTCTACGCRSWRKQKWKDGEKTRCPKCGAEVTARGRIQAKKEMVPIVILQKTEDTVPEEDKKNKWACEIAGKWVERQFKAECLWENGKKKVALQEEIRAVAPPGENWGKCWYGQKNNADEWDQEWNIRNPVNKRWKKSLLYPGNLEEILPYAGLERSGLDRVAREGQKINVNLLIIRTKENPWMEQLLKYGLYRLAADFIEEYYWRRKMWLNTAGRNRQEVLQLDGNRANRLRQMDGGVGALNWLQYEERNGIRITQEALEYLDRREILPERCRKIIEAVGSINRIVNYLKKQKGSKKSTLDLWEDYLCMAKEEGQDLQDDIVRMPKNLKARHDALVETRNARLDAVRIAEEQKKYAMLDQQISKRIPEAARYYWQDNDYMIVPAAKCRELVEEGQALHHCVGATTRYMGKMKDGKSWILFLRKKKELETPYYTLEIDMETDQIIQWYSEYDRKPDKEVIRKVLDRFTGNLKRKRIRIA